jgi:polyphosphate kinase
MGQSGRKVHAKLMLIERKPWRSKEVERFALIGTGNFHEANAKVYTDYLLLTSHAGITQDVHDCFKHMEDGEPLHLKHLIHSPHKSEAFLLNKLKQMQTHVANGGRAEVMFKCNALIHEGVINQLVESGKAGVKIRLIVRGMCALRPQIEGLTDNIEIISIVGRYLEHARVYAFAMDDRWSVHIASFDLMTRNLHQRMEVASPILDKGLADDILKHLQWQWQDGVKARVNGSEPPNRPHEGALGNSQDAQRQWCKDALPILP